MRLNHLDLQVTDVQAMVLAFERHFGLVLQTSRTSPAIAIMSDGHGFTLVLQRKKNAGDAYPEGFHLGFLVDDVATVEARHAALRADGADVSDIQRNGRGTMVYCRLGDGIVVEVSCRRAA